MSKVIFEDAYEKLANEIILVAVKDYRDALGRLNRNSKNPSALDERDSIRRFFRSDWFSCLTSIDGEMLIRKLDEEVCL